MDLKYANYFKFKENKNHMLDTPDPYKVYSIVYGPTILNFQFVVARTTYLSLFKI